MLDMPTTAELGSSSKYELSEIVLREADDEKQSEEVYHQS